jgi:hypothetical protein
VHVTVDKGDEAWTGRVGLITQALSEIAPKPAGAVAVTCGPPIMIRFVLKELEKLGFAPEQIITRLEGKMECGLGKSGRGSVGKHYICTDGPSSATARSSTSSRGSERRRYGRTQVFRRYNRIEGDLRMATAPARVVTLDIQRPGEAPVQRDEWRNCSPEERLAAVWTVTQACMGWNAEGNGEPRLQRSVAHIQRPQR